MFIPVGHEGLRPMHYCARTTFMDSLSTRITSLPLTLEGFDTVSAHSTKSCLVSQENKLLYILWSKMDTSLISQEF
jgi:hypothetical protein